MRFVRILNVRLAICVRAMDRATFLRASFFRRCTTSMSAKFTSTTLQPKSGRGCRCPSRRNLNHIFRSLRQFRRHALTRRSVSFYMFWIEETKRQSLSPLPICSNSSLGPREPQVWASDDAETHRWVLVGLSMIPSLPTRGCRIFLFLRDEIPLPHCCFPSSLLTFSATSNSSRQ
ncbi:uncharacterized protein PV07_01797 [Cladophialophora immunda]|uniref:Uncharacterized protein n=1 Tax=Cladophialophora immunda TaxID=569365 RepID=A0A0D2A466_9EURO|nr:uncharacterized protein PV07_01797 [Cladophialophora immunda]KIW35076.1 hypothetical protein PV07_01797 [Cladophialophora immunda]